MGYETRLGARLLSGGWGGKKIRWALVLSALWCVVSGFMMWNDGPGSPWAWGFLLNVFLTMVFGLLTVFSVHSTVSVLGVVLGVSALVTGFGVTSGLQRDVRDKLLGGHGHVMVEKGGADIPEYRDIEATALGIPHVTASHSFIGEEMFVRHGSASALVYVKGVDPERVVNVLDLEKYMVEGSVADLQGDPSLPGIICGKVLADKLKLQVGSKVTVSSPAAGLRAWFPDREIPTRRIFNVVGVFHAGFDEYDKRFTWVRLSDAQSFFNRGDMARGIELKLDDPYKAKQVSAILERRLGGHSQVSQLAQTVALQMESALPHDAPERSALHRVSLDLIPSRLGSAYFITTWGEFNAHVFAAWAMQKIGLLIVLTLIIVVAAFNLVSALSRMVLDRVKTVSILKAMGASHFSIASIFQTAGFVIGSTGILLGLGLGLVLSIVVSRYGYSLDAAVYMIDRLPIDIRATEVVLVCSIAFVIAFFSTLLPAIRAARLRPVDGFRED